MSDVMDDFVGVGFARVNRLRAWDRRKKEDNVFYPGSAPQCEVKTYSCLSYLGIDMNMMLHGLAIDVSSRLSLDV